MVDSLIQVLIITDQDHEQHFINAFPKEAVLKSQDFDQIIQAVKNLNPQLILLCLNDNQRQTSKLCSDLKSSALTKNIPLITIPEFDNISRELQPQTGNSSTFSPNISSQTDLIKILSTFIHQNQTLQRNEAILSMFFSHSPVYIFINEISPTRNRIIFASDNLGELLDIPTTSLLEKDLNTLAQPEFAKKLIESEWNAVIKDDITREEISRNNRNYLTIKFPMKYDGLFLLGCFTIDITEQKKSEEALRISEAHFRSIVGNSDAGYFFIDKDGIIRDVNSAWVKLYKYDSADEVIGHHFMEIQHVDDMHAAREFVDGIMRNDPNYLKGEFSRQCKDGSIGYHSFSARPVSRENEVVGIEGFIIDTTERRKAIEALRASEERYHLIDEASQDMIYSYDQHSRFTHANTFMCQRLELAPEQILGKTHEELGFPQELCDEWAALHRQVYDTNATVIAETTAPVPDGTIIHYEVVLNPIHDADGNIIGIAGTTRDIHDRKMSEKKIKEQMLELRQWHSITMGRENRILELKREVNQLLEEAGKAPKYKSVGKENKLPG